jgi:hypothetical protein
MMEIGIMVAINAIMVTMLLSILALAHMET